MRVNVFLNCESLNILLGSLTDEAPQLAFQYAPDFLKLRIQPSPLAMPNSSSYWTSPNALFDGLPGMVADSLPDGWGNLLIDRQLSRMGESLRNVPVLQRLCWIGKQGMGALEYEPEEPLTPFEPVNIVLDSLSQDVEAILAENESSKALDTLRQLNGSSGGARPKIICLVSADFNHLKRGQIHHEDFSPWLIKFKSSEDSSDLGVQEYITSLIASKAGITVPATHLFESSHGLGWFGIERFDRTKAGKMHMMTAAGLVHCDFRAPSLDYESILAITQNLCSKDELKEQLKRCVFNFAIGNSDDHAKNFSFLMNAQGHWRISPMYDAVPGNLNAEHMTSILGKGRHPNKSDFIRLGAKFDIDKPSVLQMIEEVCDALSEYKHYAKQYGVKCPKLDLSFKSD